MYEAAVKYYMFSILKGTFEMLNLYQIPFEINYGDDVYYAKAWKMWMQQCIYT